MQIVVSLDTCRGRCTHVSSVPSRVHDSFISSQRCSCILPRHATFTSPPAPSPLPIRRFLAIEFSLSLRFHFCPSYPLFPLVSITRNELSYLMHELFSTRMEMGKKVAPVSRINTCQGLIKGDFTLDRLEYKFQRVTEDLTCEIACIACVLDAFPKPQNHTLFSHVDPPEIFTSHLSYFIHMPASVESPSLSHGKPTAGAFPSGRRCRGPHTEFTVLLFSFFRFENHCRRCDRIREEPARCDNPDDVLPLRLCANGPSDLYGGPHAKVYKELSWGRLLG